MTGPAVAGEVVRLEFGPEPLRLARVTAGVPYACAVCGEVAAHRLIAGAHWWDREASARQREHAHGLSCGRCGTVAELPVPLVQYRDLDGADLVVGLPLGSAADSDRAWIAGIVGCLRGRLEPLACGGDRPASLVALHRCRPARPRSCGPGRAARARGTSRGTRQMASRNPSLAAAPGHFRGDEPFRHRAVCRQRPAGS